VKKILSLALGVAIVFAHIVPSAIAARAGNADWLDASTIRYEDKLYFDRQPFDNTREAVRTEDGCTSDFDYSSGRDSGSAHISVKTDFGCPGGDEDEDINDIAFSVPSQGFVAGYRKDATTVQIYGPKADQDGTPPTLVTLRSSTNSKAEPGRYYLEKDDGTLDFNSSIKISSSGEFSDAQGGFATGLSGYNNLNDYKLANGGQVAAQPTEITNATVGATDGVTGAEGGDPTCETNAGSSLSWILCPIINGAAIVSDGVFENFVFPFLDKQLITTDPESGMYKTWSGFRIFGNIFLVGALLVIAGAQGLGKE
jgi:hypothetical protein